jgi:hypothetical protein
MHLELDAREVEDLPNANETVTGRYERDQIKRLLPAAPGSTEVYIKQVYTS